MFRRLNVEHPLSCDHFSNSPGCLFSVFLLVLAACGSGDDAERDGGLDGGRASDGGTPTVDGGGAAPDAASDGAAADGGDAGPPDCTPARADLSSPPAGASWRYGGGIGYPDAVPSHPACVAATVRDRDELEAALGAAAAGDVVYVADDATIDLTGASLCIPGGVTLASGRGRERSPGGLLLSRAVGTTPILKPCGDDVRITGLRIRGADAGECPPEYPDRCEGVDRTGGRNCRDCMPVSRAIAIDGHDRTEIDNCELSGWSYAAVSVQDAVDVHVHHSHIHHNQRQGLGYGVVFGRDESEASAVIEWNRFDYNRHSIAASGEPATSYEARYNLALPHANGHVFDVHGHDENTDNGSEWAGFRILVHNNTVLPTDQYAVVIRGKPMDGAWIWDNCLARSSADTAVAQRYFFGNLHVDRDPSGAAAPNAYGQGPGDCESRRFCTASGAAGPWEYRAASGIGLSALGFGDFDGDGRTDVLRTSGGEWLWLSQGRGSWAVRNTSPVSLPDLRFGDFDGDGTTDVFHATGSEWRYSPGASGPWERLQSSGVTAGALAFADFDGDGTTDVFRATGSEWQVSWGGAAGWTRLNVSSSTLDRLAFGDFDGDGRDDVFTQSGGEWRHSSGGTERWATLNGSSIGVDGLAFGDFDGDGRTDVLRPDGTDWLVSWGAVSGWEVLAVASEGLGQFALGDFDGDGSTDAFRAGCL